jgi:hypothetical protein
MKGIAARTTQAPRANWVTAMMPSTVPVAVTPTPFTTRFLRQPGPRSRSHLRTIPACDRVIAVNTPTT